MHPVLYDSLVSVIVFSAIVCCVMIVLPALFHWIEEKMERW